MFQALVTLIDVTVKVLACLDVLSLSNDIAVLDDRLVRIILTPSTEALGVPVLVYIGMVLLSWILPFVYNTQE